MALRGRREPPSQSDGLGGPSYRFPQIVTALSIDSWSLEKVRANWGIPWKFLIRGIHFRHLSPKIPDYSPAKTDTKREAQAR